MRTNLKAILSAVSVAALLASPAMANSHARHHAAPSIAPYGAHASVGPYAPVAPYGAYGAYGAYGSVAPYGSAPAVTVYAPDMPTQRHENSGLNPDFQLSHE
jgi:hypothetical protein